MGETTLKPCPFCGGAADINQMSHYYRDGGSYPRSLEWRVMCNAEECPFDPCGDFTSEAEAIAAWNTRAPLPTPTEEEVARVALSVAVQDGCAFTLHKFGGRRALCFDPDADLEIRHAREDCYCLNMTRAALAAFLKERNGR